MAVTFLVAPEWQASGSSRAMRLVDGAEAIRGDLPHSSTRVIDIPLEAGDGQGSGVHRLSSIATVRDRMLEALSGVAGPAITIGGDCGVELAAVAHAATAELAVVWCDAHPDLNTPESSTSGAFSGMVLRTLLGDGPAALVPSVPLEASKVVLAGARAFDAAEESYISQSGIPVIPPGQVSPEILITAIEATGASAVYIHIDLDVLDPADLDGLDYPEPFGVRSGALVETIRALRERFDFRGAGITEFAPASMAVSGDDMPTILRLIGALAR